MPERALRRRATADRSPSAAAIARYPLGAREQARGSGERKRAPLGRYRRLDEPATDHVLSPSADARRSRPAAKASLAEPMAEWDIVTSKSSILIGRGSRMGPTNSVLAASPADFSNPLVTER